MEGFNFVTHVTGLNRPNTGKEDDDVSSDMNMHIQCFVCRNKGAGTHMTKGRRPF
jgi:hypothetical protein